MGCAVPAQFNMFVFGASNHSTNQPTSFWVLSTMVRVTPCLTWTLSWSRHYGMCCPCSIQITKTISWIFIICIFLLKHHHKQCQGMRWDQNYFFSMYPKISIAYTSNQQCPTIRGTKSNFMGTSNLVNQHIFTQLTHSNSLKLFVFNKKYIIIKYIAKLV